MSPTRSEAGQSPVRRLNTAQTSVLVLPVLWSYWSDQATRCYVRPCRPAMRVNTDERLAHDSGGGAAVKVSKTKRLRCLCGGAHSSGQAAPAKAPRGSRHRSTAQGASAAIRLKAVRVLQPCAGLRGDCPPRSLGDVTTGPGQSDCFIGPASRAALSIVGADHRPPRSRAPLVGRHGRPSHDVRAARWESPGSALSGDLPCTVSFGHKNRLEHLARATPRHCSCLALTGRGSSRGARRQVAEQASQHP